MERWGRVQEGCWKKTRVKGRKDEDDHPEGKVRRGVRGIFHPGAWFQVFFVPQEDSICKGLKAEIAGKRLCLNMKTNQWNKTAAKSKVTQLRATQGWSGQLVTTHFEIWEQLGETSLKGFGSSENALFWWGLRCSWTVRLWETYHLLYLEIKY